MAGALGQEPDALQLLRDGQMSDPGLQRASDEPIPFWKSPAFLIAVGMIALKLYERANVALKLGLPVLATDPESAGAWVENVGIIVGAWVIAHRRKAVTPAKPEQPIEPIAATVKRLTDG